MEDRGEEDESVVVNAAQISGLDEKTLACTPVPVIASSVLRPRDFKRPRNVPQPKVLWEDSNLGIAGKQDGDMNESLGLIPSHLLSGMDGSELPLDSLGASIRGLMAPQAATDGTAGSSCSGENAVAGTSSSTCDSGKLLTVLKNAHLKSAEGRMVPQTLFRSLTPVPALIEEEAEDKQPVEQAQHSLQGDNFAGVLNRVKHTLADGLKMPAPTAIEEEDADHTIHQVALEAEDLEELEEVCFDLDGSFSEDECDHNKDDMNSEKPHQAEEAFASKLYKPLENLSPGPQPHLEASESRQESLVDISCSEFGASINFLPSMQFEERPSKDLGFNPFDGQQASFVGEAFGEEEFNSHMDEGGAKAFLEQDEQAFNKESFLNNQELSMMSLRGTEETFHNLTIGTYLQARSEPLGHLGKPSLRPDLGMLIQSPPAARDSPSIQTSQEAPDSTDTSMRLSPLGGSGSIGNSPTAEPTNMWTDPQHRPFLSPRGEERPSTDTSHTQSNTNKECLPATSLNDHPSSGKTDSKQTALSLAGEEKSESFKFPDSSKISSAYGRPSLARASNMQVSSKLENTENHLGISTKTATTQGSDNMELTFSPLQELLERSDFSVSTMCGPEQDHGEFILAFLRQRTLEKRQQADSTDGRDTGSLADSGIGSGNDKDPSSLVRSQNLTEQAGGDAGRLKNYPSLAESCLSSGLQSSLSSSGPASHSTQRELRTSQEKSKVIPATRDRDVFVEEENTSLFREQHREAEEDRTLGLKDLTLSDTSVFKVPLPVLSKKSNSKSKPSPFRSKIPLHKGSASPAQSAMSNSKLSMSVDSKSAVRPNTSVSLRGGLSAPSENSNYNQSALNLRTSSVETSQCVTSKSEAPVPHSITSKQALSQPTTSTSNTAVLTHPRQPSMNTSHGVARAARDEPRPLSNRESGLATPSVAHSQVNSLVQQPHNDIGYQARFAEDDRYLAGMTSTLDTLTEETILHTMLSAPETTLVPLVTPRTVIDLLKLPDALNMPETCCVSLSTSACLPISNILPRGIKCGLAVSAVQVTLESGRQQHISPNRCPFDFKREVTLAPRSSENVQIIFQPKGQGMFTAVLEVTASSMAGTGERRVYTVNLTGEAEFPTLETDSSPGLFSFHPENPAADISSISLTSRPSGAAGFSNSILSMSLPGRVEGREVKTETVKIYCNTQALDKRNQSRYLTQAEQFYARLQVSVDQPVEEVAPLATVSLRVNVGLYKLQVDTSELNICASPGGFGSAMVKLFNTGSIVMPVRVFLERSSPHFNVSPCGEVLVPQSDGSKKGCVPIGVTFTPLSHRDTNSEDHKINLMFSNQTCDHYIPVTGRTSTSPTRYSTGLASKARTVPVKLSASTMHLSFGGVHIGHTGKERLSFTVDNDVLVLISIRQTGNTFTLLDPVEERATDSMELSAVRSKKHTVWVMFDPSTVSCYSASLIIQEPIGKRYTIGLSGYGGCSSLHLEQVNLAHSETSFWLDMGQLSAGQSIFKKFVVRNQGSRCGFIKASFCDASRSEFLPTRATVMPSSLLLQPGEAKELLAMFCPSQKEVALCMTGHALVGIIKLEHGDNIVREMFLRHPGQQPRQVISLYDIPVPSTLREIIENEMVGMSQVPNAYSALRKSTRKINIGVFGEASRDEGKTDTRRSRPSQLQQEEIEPKQSLVPVIHQPAPSPRPALTPLNQNQSPWRSTAQIVSLPHTVVRDWSEARHTFKNSSWEQALMWQIEPFAPAYFKVPSGGQEVHAAGHGVFEISPSKGYLQPGMVQTVCVRFSPQQPGSYNQVWTVMDAKHVQIHRFTVFAQAIQESPTRLREEHTMPQSSTNHHLGSTRDAGDEQNLRRSQAPTGETDITPSSLQSMKGSNPCSPHQRGTTQGDLDSASGPGPFETESGDRTSLSAGERQRPYWSSVESASGDCLDLREARVVSPALSSISGTSSAARRAGTTGSSASSSPGNSSLNRSGGSNRSERQAKGLHLVHSSLEFPSVVSGSSSVHKLFIKNQSAQDAELSVECVPDPPFLIKHLKFKVSSGKITIFPVTFKPRHVDKFKDKIVFRDSVTGKILTAILTAESKDS